MFHHIRPQNDTLGFLGENAGKHQNTGKQPKYRKAHRNTKKHLYMVKLEMCQYDTEAPAQGHPHPHAGILQKMKLKKGP